MGTQKRRRREETPGPHELRCNLALGCPHAWHGVLGECGNLDGLASHFHLLSSLCLTFIVLF